ncbi:MAG: bifunctional 23S rRNA (guanine(2069)-N(7))-methyltransferase RlmK/23S rRNA (guanine(2445)-N(2))-methyltransferase RlmL, partial [Vibrio sp.]
EALFDPMCGSGTLLIEAALMAGQVAPGIARTHWCFQALNDFDHDIWTQVKTQASVQGRRGLNNLEPIFFGCDNDPRVLQTARENAKRAGVDHLIQFSQGDAATLTKPKGFETGVIVCNPPYGERLGTEPGLIALYTAFGAALKTEFAGSRASIFSSSDDLLSCLRMRADKQYKLSNGAIMCHHKNYQITGQGKIDAVIQKIEEQIAPDFANRLKKNLTKVGKWAKKEQLECYRVYDADLPNYNVAIDRYQDHLVIQEYAAPKSVPEETAKRRLTDIIRATIQVFDVPANQVILKTRERQKGKRQYQKLGQNSDFMTVEEYGVKLLVNLHDYLDTGLFLDHKLTRRRLGQMAQGKDFLNLFAYTGSASVHAAAGGAKSTTTVDMSNTYLQWAQENMALNGFDSDAHQFEQADCLQWLKHEDRQFDLIFIDPPTFSNSKRMEQTFDVQRDHVELMTHLKRLLRPGGTIVFSNNKRHFRMDVDALDLLDLETTNISSQTLPLDFERNKHIHNCWLIQHKIYD